MKNIFKSIFAVIAAAALLSSCVQETAEPLAASVSTSVETISVAAVNGTATFDVKADGDWFVNVTNTEWFTFTPSSGHGNGTVTVTAEDNTDSYNEVNGPRSGMISVVGNSGIAVVEVKQIGESGLDSKRTYSKVTKASDIELDKSYLIVASSNGTFQTAKSFSASSESDYSWIYTDEVTEDSGVITLPNGNYGFVFVKKDDGFAIQQPNGRYLFQGVTYHNFYSTTDISKADVWAATVNEDGTVKLENQTIAGKYFQYSVSYSSYGAYPSAQDNSVVPMLYKDSAAPSDEVIEVASETTVSGTKTVATIKVKSNKTWKVRNHDSWIKSFTKEGSGDGNIEVTFDANDSYENTKTATFQIIGETTNFYVTLVQDHLYHVIDATVAEVLAAEDGDQKYRVTGAVVSNAGEKAKYGTNFYIKDATGEIYVYGSYNSDETPALFSTLGIKAGDILTIEGPKGSFKGAGQFVDATITKSIIAKTATVTELIDAPVASTYLESQYYNVTGIVKSIAGATYGNIYLKAQDSEDYIYVYGLTNAPVAKNDKSFNSLGIKEGDILTMVCQRGYFANAKVADQKEEAVNAFYVSHETPSTADITFTEANLPTSYPTTPADVTYGEYTFSVYNVANFGGTPASYIQMKKGGSYIKSKTEITKGIKTIRVNNNSGKSATWYPTNIVVKGFAAAGDEGTVISPEADTDGSTYDFSAGSYKYFSITNTSSYAVYLKSIEVTFK